jgi:hypothetical protein
VLQIAVALLLVMFVAGCGARAAGRAPENGAWQVSGQLQAWDGELWIVDAMPIVVSGQLRANAPPILGGEVTASGIRDDAGRRLATAVSIVAGGTPDATLPAVTLDGVIDGAVGEHWSVAGAAVWVTADTQLNAPAGDVAQLRKSGNLAHVEGYRLPSGELLALSVSLAPAPTDVTTSQPTATPTSEQPLPTATATDAPALEPTQAPAPQATEPPDDAQPPPGDDNGGGSGGDDGGGHGHGHDQPKKPKKPKHAN